MESKWVDISKIKVGDLLHHNYWGGNETLSVCIEPTLKETHSFTVIASQKNVYSRQWYLASNAVIAGKHIDKKDIILYVHWQNKTREFFDLLKGVQCQET
jgi:hypothetical protein